MYLSEDKLNALLDAVERFRHQTIVIFESISRSRNVGGHDRHFSTMSQFILKVEYINVAISGLQLTLSDAKQTYYGIALDVVTDFTVDTLNGLGRDDEGTLEIIEQFEAETERLTRIRVAI